MAVHPPLSPEEMKAARDFAQSSLHRARTEAAARAPDHWRGVALRLSKLILALTRAKGATSP